MEQIAERHLSSIEPKFADAIQNFGPCALVGHRAERSVYETLMRSIFAQQLSQRASETIRRRFYDLFPEYPFPPPELVASLDLETFRLVGVSRQKATYLQSLAQLATDLPAPEELDELDDEAIIKSLSRVRGIGRWTVEMLLIFRLGRPNVLPLDDIAMLEGCKRMLGLPARPTKKQMLEIARPWEPYRSVATWYLWTFVDPAP